MIICSLFAACKVEALEICGELKQGELILIKNAEAKKIVVSDNLKDREYNVYDNGTALIALHRDVPQKVELREYPLTDAATFYNLQIIPVKWDIQRVNGVAQHKVTPDKSHQKEINREFNDVNKALSTYSNHDFWRQGFILPVDGRISGQFGNQRVFNGVPKNPHSGTDIAAPQGTPVKASGSGKVVLSGKNYFYTGNLVIINHGAGLQTIYAHLQKATVKEGDEVKQGDIIGFVGQTGRASGAHLHWGASLNGVRFRPHSLLNINDKSCKKINGKYMGE
ncbi:MAG: M23 family metallopeptidase [Alphaproteobacteria bacterium]|nr:M23 family metallopeptidase [Alphaproteobacteria bacterium]